MAKKKKKKVAVAKKNAKATKAGTKTKGKKRSKKETYPDTGIPPESPQEPKTKKGKKKSVAKTTDANQNAVVYANLIPEIHPPVIPEVQPPVTPEPKKATRAELIDLVKKHQLPFIESLTNEEMLTMLKAVAQRDPSIIVPVLIQENEPESDTPVVNDKMTRREKILAVLQANGVMSANANMSEKELEVLYVAVNQMEPGKLPPLKSMEIAVEAPVAQSGSADSITVTAENIDDIAKNYAVQTPQPVNQPFANGNIRPQKETIDLSTAEGTYKNIHIFGCEILKNIEKHFRKMTVDEIRKTFFTKNIPYSLSVQRHQIDNNKARICITHDGQTFLFPDNDWFEIQP